ncbi:uncharacterized protein VNE69_08132 [Vairimorpha necatrix]|uniref:Uncharacterized protein n=1 Tax=Vairimorpha necatrix TaxID=6039 RepID=A0AAX4JEH0_9MICR
MNIFVNFILILFIQGCQDIYNKLNYVINKKIENRDYVTIDLNKDCLRINLMWKKDTSSLIASLNIDFFDNIDKISLIEINCIDKCIEIIVKELEEKLSHEIKKTTASCIILNYFPLVYECIPIYRNVVIHLKKTNIIRKDKKLNHEIFYTCIIENNIIWNIVFKIIKFNNLESEYKHEIDFPLNFIRKNNNLFICFYINLENLVFFFEIDVKDLDVEKLFPYINIITSHTNETDKIISKIIHELYKKDKIYRICNSYTRGMTIYNRKKVVLIYRDFEIELNDDSLQIKQKSAKYNYSFKDDSNYNGIKSNIDDKCFLEFQDFFRKLYIVIEKDECSIGVEMFYRLIESYGKVLFFVNRILNNRGTILNIIFTHLLLANELIDNNELHKIILDDKLNDLRIIELQKTILEAFSNHSVLSCTMLMKICLFFDAERYINENDINNESIFGTLKKIGKLISLKDKNQTDSELNASDAKEKIDLLEIYQDAVSNHLDDIENFKNIVREYVFDMTSLFTGKMKNISENDINYIFNIRTEVTTTFNMEKKIIQSNNDTIRKKLQENYRKDEEKDKINQLNAIKSFKTQLIDKNFIEEDIQHYKNKVKRIIYKNVITKFKKQLNEVVDFTDIEITSKFFINFKYEIFNIIERMMEYDDIIKETVNLILIVDKDFINNFKIDKNLNQKLKFYINENIRKHSKTIFPAALIQVFESNFTNDKNFKIKCAKKLDYIQSVLNSEDILFLYNESGKKLLKDLLAVLETKKI